MFYRRGRGEGGEREGRGRGEGGERRGRGEGGEREGEGGEREGRGEERMIRYTFFQTLIASGGDNMPS